MSGPSWELSRGRAWAIFCAMSVMYCFSMFYRVSTALIAVDLNREMGLGPARLSLLGGAFFYAFAFAQIPLGPALDRFGARRIVIAGTLVGAVGALLFAGGRTWGILLAARSLMGLGMAPILMGSLKLFSQWFAPGHFGTVSGLIMALGGLGSLLASSPLAGLVAWVGWRPAIALFGLLTLVCTAVLLRVVRDAPGFAPAPGRSAGDSLRQVFRTPNFWAMAPLALVGYASIASLQGLWAGPYFMESLGYSRAETGRILFALGLTSAVGTALAGYLSDRVLRTRKWVVIGGTIPATLLMLPLIGIGAPASPGAWSAVLGGVGLFAAGRGLVYTHAKESLPRELAGTAVTTINFFIMIGPGLMQQAMGFVLRARPGDYRTAFLIPVAALCIGALTYAGTRDSHPR